MTPEHHERRFHGDADRLRSAERVGLLEVERVVKLCLDGPDISSVIDIGTGTGVFAEAFHARGLQVAGVDANRDLLKRARSHVPSGEFKIGRAEELPFPESFFGLAFLGHVLHETDDAVLALQEAGRVATIRVAVLEWPYIEEAQGPPLVHRLSPKTVMQMAGQAGLGAVEHIQLNHMDLYRMAVGPPTTPGR